MLLLGLGAGGIIAGDYANKYKAGNTIGDALISSSVSFIFLVLLLVVVMASMLELCTSILIYKTNRCKDAYLSV